MTLYDGIYCRQHHGGPTDFYEHLMICAGVDEGGKDICFVRNLNHRNLSLHEVISIMILSPLGFPRSQGSDCIMFIDSYFLFPIQGDSGSPAVQYLGPDGVAIQVGVASFVRHSCAHPSFPGVYANLSAMVRWIRPAMVAVDGGGHGEDWGPTWTAPDIRPERNRDGAKREAVL